MYPLDFSADTLLLTQKLVEVAKSKHNLRVNLGTSVEGFVFKNNTDEVLGVITSSGLLLCDRIVVATGNAVKHTLQ